MTKTVIALFDNLGQAQDAVDALRAEGFAPERIQLQTGHDFLERTRLPPPEHERERVWPAIKRFLDELGLTTPAPPEEGAYRPIERDDAIVLLEAADDRAEVAADLLERRGAASIEQRAAAASRSPRRASGLEPATSGRTPPSLREVPPDGDIDERALATGRPRDRGSRRAARVYDAGDSDARVTRH